MICSACHTVYAPSEKELGKVSTLAGLCEKCGSRPHFMPFATAYTEGACAALATILFVLLIYLSGTVRAAVVLAVCVLAACLAMWLYARRSTVVRYANERDRNAATWPHRLLGFAFGVATPLVVFIMIQTTAL